MDASFDLKFPGVLDDVVKMLISDMQVHDHNRLTLRMSLLLEDSGIYLGRTLLGLTYKGKIYAHPSWSASAKIPMLPELRPIVPEHLAPRMDEYVSELNHIEGEAAKIKQNLTIALKKCDDMQSVRDTLTDYVWGLLRVRFQLDERPRLNPVGYSLRDTFIPHKQYLKATEIMNMYSVIALAF